MVYLAFATPILLSTATARHRSKCARMTATAPSRTTGAATDMQAARIGILGASGYTGAELLRLLSQHPQTSIELLTGERSAGSSIGTVYPQFAIGPHSTLPNLVRTDEADYTSIDLVFCCLPHAATQEIISILPPSLRVVDLSADFRLRDVQTYAQWYGRQHLAPELQKTAVYGLTELTRDQVRGARLVANPGCYPTAAQLPLIPLLRAGLLKTEGIIIDAKSGVTGAGRAAKTGSLYCEVADGISAYGVASHRHSPEIEQGLSDAAGAPVFVSFTPHLVPMARGILETIYVTLANGVTVSDLRACLATQYAEEPFVHLLPDHAAPPQTRHLRASNFCVMQVIEDRVEGRAIIVSAIDNVVKGASGQAIQNMNLMLGFEETMGLQNAPVFP